VCVGYVLTHKNRLNFFNKFINLIILKIIKNKMCLSFFNKKIFKDKKIEERYFIEYYLGDDLHNTEGPAVNISFMEDFIEMVLQS